MKNLDQLSVMLDASWCLFFLMQMPQADLLLKDSLLVKNSTFGQMTTDHKERAMHHFFCKLELFEVLK